MKRFAVNTFLPQYQVLVQLVPTFHLECSQLLKALDYFIVVEREGHIIACAALFPFFKEKCGEVAAIAVSPDCRGQGQGDKLLGTS